MTQFIFRLAVKFFDLNFIVKHLYAKLFVAVFAMDKYGKHTVTKL